MLEPRWKKRLISTALGGAALLAPSVALADPCPEDLPNPIYGAGGSAVTATLKQVAIALAGLPDPITVFYHDPGACIGFQEFIDGTIPTTTTTTVKYWNADGESFTCEPPASGLPVDFSHMGNAADFCVGFEDGLPDGIGDFLAPVQTVNIITALDSSQRSISAEALYYILGKGAAAGGVAPWTNPSHMILRTRSSFVHQFVADSVFGNLSKVFYDHPSLSTDKDQRLGVEVQTNQQSVDGVAAAGATNPESPLGYVSGSAADANRDKVKTLAYQHFGQSCAYWPDSSESTYDKINVRQGLYHFWTPGHFFAPVDDDGEFINPLVAEFIGYFTGRLPSPEGVDPPIIDRIIEAGDIPLCAMQVTREGTTGAISSYAPDEPCGCYFEKVATGDTNCATCEDDDDCDGDQKCRLGFCEAY